MIKQIPLFVGLRYIRAKRRNQFISFISAVSLLGMTLGTLSLIVVLSVMNGFDRELKNRILNVIPHGYIYAEPDETAEFSARGVADWQLLRQRVVAHDDVVAAAPYIRGSGMIAQFGTVRGVNISGVLPAEEKSVSLLTEHFLAGHIESLASGEYNMVIGSILARQLGVTLGDKVTLVLPQVSITPLGIFPRMKRFTITGVFQIGAQLDSSATMIHLDDAKRLFRYGDNVEGLRVKVNDMYTASNVLDDVVKTLPAGFSAQDWSKTQGGLFKAVKMEKTVITLLLMIVIAVAAFNIISILIMMVTDKRSDIAVLRTLGASPRVIMGIFVIQGSGIGVMGTFIGACLGILLALNVSDIAAFVEDLLGVQLFNPDIYFISFLPSHLMWQDVVVVCSSALVLSFLAAVYPAYRAAQIQPAEALRYE